MANLYYQTPEGKEFLKRNPPAQTKVDQNCLGLGRNYTPGPSLLGIIQNLKKGSEIVRTDEVLLTMHEP